MLNIKNKVKKIDKKIVMMLLFFGLGCIVLNITNVIIPKWADSLKDSKGYFKSIYTWTYVSMYFASFFAVPIWNSIKEKYGQRPVIIISALTYGTAQALIGTVGHYHIAIVIALRVVVGAAGGPILFSTLRALLSSVANEDNRTTVLNCGAIIQGFAVGGIFLIMGVVSKSVDFKWIFIIQSITMALFVFIFLMTVKHSEKPKMNLNLWKETKEDLIGLKGKGFYHLLIGYMPMALFLTSATTLFRKKIINPESQGGFGFGTEWVAYLQVIISLLTIVVTILIIPVMKKYIGLKISSALMSMIACIILVITIQKFNNAISTIILFAIFQSLITAAQSFYISSATAKFTDRAATVMSVFSSVTFLGSGLGMLILHYIQDTTNLGDNTPYIAVGGIMATVAYLFIRKEIKLIEIKHALKGEWHKHHKKEMEKIKKAQA